MRILWGLHAFAFIFGVGGCTYDFPPIPTSKLPDAGDASVRSDAADGSTPDANVVDTRSSPDARIELDATTEARHGDAGMDADSTRPILDCAKSRLENEAMVDTRDQSDTFSLSCGSGTGKDVAYEFRAPHSGYYAFDTSGSDFDTVLGLLHGACDGTELSCNNNAGKTLQSELVEFLEKDGRVLVVVDGNTGEAGRAALRVEAVQCPGHDLTGQPLPVAKTTADASNEHGGSCGGDEHPERSYRYTPSSDGLYRARVSSNDFHPAVYLEAGARCGGVELGCGYSQAGAYPAEVTRYLEADEPVTLIVDSREGKGNFELDIQKLEGRSCPANEEADLLPPDSNDPAPVLATDGSHLLSSSCQPTGGFNPTGSVPFPDHSYPFSHSIQENGSCAYRVLSNEPLVVSLLEGTTCSKNEYLCKSSVAQTSDAAFAYEASFTLGHQDSGNYVLVVESADANYDVSYRFEYSCMFPL